MKKAELLQHLVRILEAAPNPAAVVRSPAHVADRTGRMREVDVLIEERFRGETVRSFLECRHHRRRVDVGYIEQVVTKRNDLGLHNVHVVAASGFTAGAVAKAKAHAVFLSTLSDTADPAWAAWLLGVPVCEIRRFAQIHAWAPVLPDGHAPIAVPVEWASQPGDKVQLYDEVGKPTKTVGEVLQADMPADCWNGINHFDPPTSRRGLAKLAIPDDRRRFVLAGEALIPVSAFTLDLEWGWQPVRLNPTFAEYKSVLGDARKGEMARVTLDDGTLLTVCQSSPNAFTLSGLPPTGRGTLNLDVRLLGRREGSSEFKWFTGRLQGELPDSPPGITIGLRP